MSPSGPGAPSGSAWTVARSSSGWDVSRESVTALLLRPAAAAQHARPSPPRPAARRGVLTCGDGGSRRACQWLVVRLCCTASLGSRGRRSNICSIVSRQCRRMLVDIVQTFDEQAFDGRRSTVERSPGAGPSRNERRDERDGDGTGDAEPGAGRVPGRVLERAARDAAPRARGGSARCGRATSGSPRAGVPCSGSSLPSVVARRHLSAGRRPPTAPSARRRSCGTSCSPARRSGDRASRSPRPAQDVRDVVLDLVRLNELPDAGLMAGQVDRRPRRLSGSGESRRVPASEARLALPH